MRTKRTQLILAGSFVLALLCFAGLFLLIHYVRRAAPTFIISNPAVVTDVVVTGGISSRSAPVLIPEDLDTDILIEYLAGKQMVWSQTVKNRPFYSGEEIIHIVVNTADEDGFINIFLGEENLVLMNDTLYQITEGEQVLTDIMAMLDVTNVVSA